MEEILEGLNQTSGVQGALIVGKDGLIIAHSGGMGGADPHMLGAASSELYSAAEAMLGEKLEQGTVDLLHLEGESAKYVMAPINDELFLLAITRAKANLGLLRWEIRRAAERLRDVV